MTPPLVSVSQLAQAIRDQPRLVLLDTRFELNAPEAGEAAYRASHLPGAHHAHLNRDLSGRASRDNGRHPLPEFKAWRQTVAQWGVAPNTPVVVYDDQGGAFAARAWWLLKQLGHTQVSVLDGGWSAWRAQGQTLSSGQVLAISSSAAYPSAATDWHSIRQAHEVLATMGQDLLIDARSPERYRGDTEPLDAMAGHIPGAKNHFFKDNLGPDGLFKPASVLRAQWSSILQGHPPEQTIHYCGSGVTACHNLLALTVAGLPGALLYPGSWSQWCNDPTRPVARA